jgi:hypothetical protein
MVLGSPTNLAQNIGQTVTKWDFALRWFVGLARVRLDTYTQLIGRSPHNHLSTSSHMREAGYSSLTSTSIVDLVKLKDCELN